MNTAVVADLELLHHEALQPCRHLPVDLETDDVAAAPALERGLVKRDQVLGLLLHLDVAVAQDAEGAVASRQESGKQARQEHADDGLDADEADRGDPILPRAVLRGQADEADKLHGDRQQRVHGRAVALAPQLHSHGDAAVLDERERMRRVDGKRRQDRQVLGFELVVEPFAFGRPQLLGLDDVDAGRDHFGPQRGEAGLLVAAEAGGHAVDLDQLLDGRQAVLAHLGDTGGDLAVEAGRPHHVELVEVGGRDRQEAQALEQWVARVVRFLEHAPIELKPGQLTIEEAGGAGGRRRDRRVLGWLHAFFQSRLWRAHG